MPSEVCVMNATVALVPMTFCGGGGETRISLYLPL